MTFTASTSEQRPIGEMNATPLIDVLLVLLVMFIITIPIQSHAVKLDLPGGPPPEMVDPTKNLVIVTDDGQVLWNGRPVSKAELAANLAWTARQPIEPELHIRPDPHSPYLVVDELLAASKRAGVTRLGFVGNEAYQRAF